MLTLSNGRQKDDTKEHVHRESPLTSCVLFPKYVFDCLHVVSFLACVAGVRNFKNFLLMNHKIYVHDGWVFVCYQYRGILYCNALPAFSLRDTSCNAPINVNPVGGGEGVRARGGDLMPETIPMSGF